MQNEEISPELEEHLTHQHSITPVSTYLREVVYGGVDGIITTFAIVAGFTGASFSNEATTQLSFVIVLLFGFANLLADAFSMGLSNFLAVRSDKSMYQKIRLEEEQEIRFNREMEIEETVMILTEKGFSEEDAQTLANIYSKNEKYWLDFMMNHELHMSNPDGENAVYTSIATFLSFVFFGFIPLIPFILFADVDTTTVFQLSAAGAFLALALLGVLKWKVTGMHFLRSIFEIVLIGGIAAVIAFVVGSLFSV